MADTIVSDEELLKKKEALREHLPFISKMMEKVKGTDYEKKWQQMYNCITNDKKKLNLAQIQKMDSTINDLKKKICDVEVPKPVPTGPDKKPNIADIALNLPAENAPSAAPITTSTAPTATSPSKPSSESSSEKPKSSTDSSMPEERLAYKYNVKKKVPKEIEPSSRDPRLSNTYADKDSSFPRRDQTSFYQTQTRFPNFIPPDNSKNIDISPTGNLESRGDFSEPRSPKTDFWERGRDPISDFWERGREPASDFSRDSRNDFNRDPRTERERFWDSTDNSRPSTSSRDPRLSSNNARFSNSPRDNNDDRPPVGRPNSYEGDMRFEDSRPMNRSNSYDPRSFANAPQKDFSRFGGKNFDSRSDNHYGRKSDSYYEKSYNSYDKRGASNVRNSGDYYSKGQQSNDPRDRYGNSFRSDKSRSKSPPAPLPSVKQPGIKELETFKIPKVHKEKPSSDIGKAKKPSEEDKLTEKKTNLKNTDETQIIEKKKKSINNQNEEENSDSVEKKNPKAKTVEKKKKSISNKDDQEAGCSGIKPKPKKQLNRIKKLSSSSESENDLPLTERVEENKEKVKKKTKKKTANKAKEAAVKKEENKPIEENDIIKTKLAEIYSNLAAEKNQDILKVLDILGQMVKKKDENEPEKTEEKKVDMMEEKKVDKKEEKKVDKKERKKVDKKEEKKVDKKEEKKVDKKEENNEPEKAEAKKEPEKSEVEVPVPEPVEIPVPKPKNVTVKRTVAKKKKEPRIGPKKRGNRELEALNEDIDNMFDRDGVLRATGRRACTLAPKPVEEPVEPEVEVKTSPKTKSPKAPAPKKQKKKVALSTLAKKLTKPCSVALSRTEISEYMMFSGSTASSEYDYTIDFVPTRRQVAVKRGNFASAVPSLPKKIKIENNFVHPANAVASTSQQSLNMSAYLISDSELVDIKKEELDVKPNKRKNVNVTCKPTTKRFKTKVKDGLDDDIDECVNNTNINMHPISQYHVKSCELCPYKQNHEFEKMVLHYKNVHPESEVLISRLPPTAAAKVKKNPMHVKGIRQENGDQIMSDCMFCEQARVMSTGLWKTHILGHTGEYIYQCVECDQQVLSRSGGHLNKQFKPCLSIMFKQIKNDLEFQANHLYAYMCDTCHYVQMDRQCLEVHVTQEHFDSDSVRILKFSLLNFDANLADNDESDLIQVSNEIDIAATGEDDEWEDLEDDGDEDMIKSKKVKKKKTNRGIAKMMLNKNSNQSMSSVSVKSGSSRDSMSKMRNVSLLTMSPKTTAQIVNLPYRRVQNIGFAMSSKGPTFDCNINNCGHKSVSRDDLTLHLFSMHQNSQWDGYCCICGRRVANISSMLAEISHFEQCHAKDSENISPANNGVGLSENNKGNIKIRALPGDTLTAQSVSSTNSTDMTRSLILPSILKQSTVVPTSTNVSPGNQSTYSLATSPQNQLRNITISNANGNFFFQKPQTTTTAGPTPMVTIPGPSKFDPLVSLDLLRPWLKETFLYVKTYENVKDMKKEVALFALFKCMATRCTYYSSDENIFLQHLTCHEKNYEADQKRYCLCAYCKYVAPDISSLKNHVKMQHQYDKYQCAYCFYRSCVDYNVIVHMDEYHFKLPRKILECNLPAIPEMAHIESIRNGRNSFVPAMICVYCKAKFFVLDMYKTHLEQHPDASGTKCIKCSKRVEKMDLPHHLLICHGFGTFQCCYCKFGTENLTVMRRHLANQHPTKLTYVCQRCTSLSLDPKDVNSIESTNLLKISLDVDVNLFRKCYFVNQDLLNTSMCLKINDITPADLQPKKSYTTIIPQNSMLQTNSAIPNKSTVTQIVIPSTGVRMTLNNNQIIRNINPQQGQQILQLSPQSQNKPNITLNKQTFSQITLSPSKSTATNNLQCRTLKTINGTSLNIKQIYNISNLQSQQQPSVNIPTTVPKISNSFSLNTGNGNANVQTQPTAQTVKIQNSQLAKPGLQTHQIHITQDISSTFNQIEVDKAINKMVCDSGVDFSMLYQCCVKPCVETFEEPQSLLNHLRTHKLAPHYECLHCSKKFSCPINYKNHLVEHSLKRFFCYLCYHKDANRVKIDDHLSQVHKIYDSVCYPTNPNKTNMNRDTFVVCPKTVSNLHFINFLKKFIEMGKYQETVNSQKTRFKPSEIDFIPTSAIFVNPLYCDVCDYNTKVRTNLLRHLRMMCGGKPLAISAVSSIPSTTKVIQLIEPVIEPASTFSAANKFEEMDVDDQIIEFDEIEDENDHSSDKEIEFVDVSDISSSVQNQTKDSWPKFVPTPKRYSCNSGDCTYQSINDDLFRQHLKTFHQTVRNYKCPHCDLLLCLDLLDINNVVDHMKLHGETLFKCSACLKCHFDYNLLNAHISDTHDNDDSATVITLRNFSSEKQPEVVGGKFTWFCELCPFTETTKTELSAHILEVHDLKCQYKCSHCDVSGHTIRGFEMHFKKDHPDIENLKVLYAFSQRNLRRPSVNNQSDLQVASISTQPIWRRNMIKTKHIRGILFEPELNVKSRGRQKTETVTKKEDELKEIEPRQVTEGPIKPKSIYEFLKFSCFHCNKPYGDLESLTRHWNIRHKNPILTSDSITYPGKPFRFYVQKVLCCFHCNFCSYFEDVKSHIVVSHPHLPTILIEASVKDKCGMCSFTEPEKSKLEQHFMLKHSQDVLKKENSGPEDFITDQLIDSILESTNILYICKKCEEFKSCVLPDIENHMILAHGMTVSQEFHHFYDQQKIDLKVDTFKTMSYECRYSFMTNSCNTVINNFNELVSHMYNHFTHRAFMCIFCVSFGGQLEFLISHYRKEHPDYYSRITSKAEEFKYRKPLELCNEFNNNRLIFVNGFTMTFREAVNTRYDPSKRILAGFNEKSLKSFTEFKKTNSFSIKCWNFNNELVDPEVDIEESNKILLKTDDIWKCMQEAEKLEEEAREAKKLEEAKEAKKLEEAAKEAKKLEEAKDAAEKEAKELEEKAKAAEKNEENTSQEIDYDKISVFDAEKSELIPYKLYKVSVNLEPRIMLNHCTMPSTKETETKLEPKTDDESSDELIIDENPAEPENIDENPKEIENLNEIEKQHQDPNGNCSKQSPLYDPESSSVLRDMLLASKNPEDSKMDVSDDDEEVVLIVDSSIDSSVLRDMLMNVKLPEALKSDDDDDVVLIVENSE